MNDNESGKSPVALGCFEDMAAEELDRRLRATMDAAVKALPTLDMGHAGGAWGRTLVQTYREVIRLTQDALATPSMISKRRNVAECMAIASALVAADESRALQHRAREFASRRQLQISEGPPPNQVELAEIIALRPATVSGG